MRRKLTHHAADCALGSALSTLQADHRFPFRLPNRKREFSDAIHDHCLTACTGGKTFSRFIRIYNSTGFTHPCRLPIGILLATNRISSKGDSNEVFPPDGAFIMQEQLANAKDGARLYFIRGACTQSFQLICMLRRDSGGQGCLGVVPESASIANRVFASFLARQPPARSDPVPPHPTRLDEALQRLSEIVDNPDIASRDALSPMAFSCVSPAVVRRRAQIYAQAAAGHRGAFSPLDNHGRPKRKYVALLRSLFLALDVYVAQILGTGTGGVVRD